MPISILWAGVFLSIISTAFFIAVNGAVLKLASYWLKFREKRWGTAYKVAAWSGLVSFIFSLIPTWMATQLLALGAALSILINISFIVVNALVLIYLVKRFYEVALGKATLAWLIVFVINLILGFLIGLIIGIIGIGLALGATRFV